MNPEKPILIVEDEIFVALDIERILCEQGYSVAAIAADRNEALAAVDHAELAFVDINLRDGMTGPEIAADLARKGVKVIYVTANPAQIDPPAETAIGFIRKPFSDQSILAAAALGYGRIDHARAAEADVTVFGP
ncbi:CheY-like chemotaxis protein [Rhodoligotrophos appendicifer]|uniref:response regulator n=1 Tax=Rhodoligotrophos appendicifer TaxID=987056 RepID=UPI001184B93F|nr:response regulator [Rhodoligotrophos appendicifer]